MPEIEMFNEEWEDLKKLSFIERLDFPAVTVMSTGNLYVNVMALPMLGKYDYVDVRVNRKSGLIGLIPTLRGRNSFKVSGKCGGCQGATICCGASLHSVFAQLRGSRHYYRAEQRDGMILLTPVKE